MRTFLLMRALVVAAVALCGCGGPAFDGIWRGTISLSYACTNGSTVMGNSDVQWDIEQAGPEARVTVAGDPCAPFVADVSGNTAAVRAKICGGGTTLESGSLTLESPSSMRLSLKGGSTTSSGAPCSGITTGTLARAQ